MQYPPNCLVSTSVLQRTSSHRLFILFVPVVFVTRLRAVPLHLSQSAALPICNICLASDTLSVTDVELPLLLQPPPVVVDGVVRDSVQVPKQHIPLSYI